jgi:hypothetical protein
VGSACQWHCLSSGAHTACRCLDHGATVICPPTVLATAPPSSTASHGYKKSTGRVLPSFSLSPTLHHLHAAPNHHKAIAMPSKVATTSATPSSSHRVTFEYKLPANDPTQSFYTDAPPLHREGLCHKPPSDPFQPR